MNVAQPMIPIETSDAISAYSIEVAPVSSFKNRRIELVIAHSCVLGLWAALFVDLTAETGREVLTAPSSRLHSSAFVVLGCRSINTIQYPFEGKKNGSPTFQVGSLRSNLPATR